MSKCVKCGNEILTGDIHWEMGLCNNCYNELYKDHKTHISLDKIWLKLAQDFRDENEKLQDKVADLEAKLAESEKSKESYRLQNEQHHLQLLQFYSRLGVEAFGADIHEKALETLMIMKEQLAEKEKENTKLKEVLDCVDKLKQFNDDMKDYALVNRDVADEIYCEHQDKISFAIDELEKVKETFIWGKDNGYLTPENAVNIIDNQIKQLKEGK